MRLAPINNLGGSALLSRELNASLQLIKRVNIATGGVFTYRDYMLFFFRFVLYIIARNCGKMAYLHAFDAYKNMSSVWDDIQERWNSIRIVNFNIVWGFICKFFSITQKFCILQKISLTFQNGLRIFLKMLDFFRFWRRQKQSSVFQRKNSLSCYSEVEEVVVARLAAATTHCGMLLT